MVRKEKTLENQKEIGDCVCLELEKRVRLMAPFSRGLHWVEGGRREENGMGYMLLRTRLWTKAPFRKETISRKRNHKLHGDQVLVS